MDKPRCCCKDLFYCNCSKGNRIEYLDIDKVRCETNYKFHSIKDFDKFCEFYGISHYETFTNKKFIKEDK